MADDVAKYLAAMHILEGRAVVFRVRDEFTRAADVRVIE